MHRAVDGRRAGRLGSTAVAGAGALLALAATAASGGAPVHADTTTTQTFSTAGPHAFVVPANVTSIHVVAVGQSGAGGTFPIGAAPKTNAPFVDANGGDGAEVIADLSVAPGDNLCLFINFGSGPGGLPTSGHAGDGGGETDVRTSPDTSPTCANSTTSMRLIVAAGGGGGPTIGTIVPPPLAPKNGFVIPTTSTGGHGGWGTATPGNPVPMPQPCAPGASGVAAGGATVGDQGGGGGCGAAGAGGSGPSGATAGGVSQGGGGGSTTTGAGGGGGAGGFGGGGGAADQSSGGGGGGGASCAPCTALLGSTASTGLTLDSFRAAAAGSSVHTTAVALKPGATVQPAGGAAPVVTLTFTTVIPVPATGAATSVLWQVVLLVTGVALIGAAGLLRRGQASRS